MHLKNCPLGFPCKVFWTWNILEWSAWRRCSVTWSQRPSMTSCMILITERCGIKQKTRFAKFWKSNWWSKLWEKIQEMYKRLWLKLKTSDMGQAHAGVKGAGDVEPEQRPLLLRNPLSGPCQKQRFCSPGNIPSCLSQILPMILLCY